MKQIDFNKKQYQIPTDWKDVSIRKMREIQSIDNSQSHIKMIQAMSVYTGIPVAELKSADTNQLIDIMSELSFIDTRIDSTPIFKFTFKGEEYNVAHNILKQEFQDYVASQTAIMEFKTDNWKQLSYLLAVMAKKEGETLDDYDVNERAEYMLDIDVETCNRVSAFFLSNQRASDFITMSYSPTMVSLAVQDKVKEFESTLNQLKKSRGSNLLIRLWIGITRRYVKSLSQAYMKSLHSPVSDNSTPKWKQIWKRLQWKKVKESSK